jgi:DNA polymerase-3 subunit chi
VVVNLDAEVPGDFDTLDRLIEIVGAEAEQAERGRNRWRAYKAAGLSITHHPAQRSRA